MGYTVAVSAPPSDSPAGISAPVASSVRVLDDERLMELMTLPERASAQRPLPRVLHDLVATLARVTECEIVSFYVRQDDELIMRANVGFPTGAIGNVALHVGQGLVGFAAECLRAVVATHADADAHYSPIEGLGEESYPVFAALPVIVGGQAQGVVVFQRAQGRVFSDADLLFFSAALGSFELALAGASWRRRQAEENRSGGRQLRLEGRGYGGGKALGRAQLLPSMAELVGDASVARVEPSFAAVAQRVRRALKRVGADDQALADATMQLLLVLEDARFRSAVLEATEAQGVAAGLSAVARRYALVPYGGAGSDWLRRRASEVGSLCRLLAAEIGGQPIVRQGEVLLVPDQPGLLLLLEARRANASGLVVADALSFDHDGAVLEHLLKELPTVSEVASLFDWVRTGDPLLVDAELGALHVHPSPARAAEALRSERTNPAGAR